MGSGTRVRLPYIQTFTDKTGKVRRYFRRPGMPRIALPGRPGSAEFHTAYNAALVGMRAGSTRRDSRAPPGSVGGAIAAYYTDTSFLRLAAGTQQARRPILERFRNAVGDLPIDKMEQKHLAAMLGKMKPFAARNWLKAIRGLMQYAKRIGLREDDPTQDIEMLRVKPGEFHTWTEDEIDQFERHHPVGTRPRLAMALLLYTAARRSDATLLGHQHLRNGRLAYRQQKTGRAMEIPFHPELARIVSETPSGNLTFLATQTGRPYTAKAFGKLFRRWCDEAGLSHCSAHGLRKAQARRLAEAGCSTHEIAAITGHKTLKEVQRYTDAANQARLAEQAFGRTKGEPRLSNRPNRTVKPA